VRVVGLPAPLPAASDSLRRRIGRVGDVSPSQASGS
jgi:hypothetical protein